MKIVLKNIKYAAFASEETYCFEASIYIDGVKSGTASNEGRGGETSIHPHSTFLKIQEYAKTLPEEITELKGNDGKPFVFQPDADSVIVELVTDWLYMKDLKSALSKKILFTQAGSDDIYETKSYKKEQINYYLTNPNSMKDLKADRILNNMPIEEALALYRKK